jgi:hypothetical protein
MKELINKILRRNKITKAATQNEEWFTPVVIEEQEYKVVLDNVYVRVEHSEKNGVTQYRIMLPTDKWKMKNK